MSNNSFSLEKILSALKNNEIDVKMAYNSAFGLLFDSNYDSMLIKNLGISRPKEELKRLLDEGISKICIGLDRYAKKDKELLLKIDSNITEKLRYEGANMLTISFVQRDGESKGTYNCVTYADLFFLSLLKLGKVDLLHAGGVVNQPQHVFMVFKVNDEDIEIGGEKDMYSTRVVGWDELLKVNQSNVGVFARDTDIMTQEYAPNYKTGNDGYD